MNKKEMVIVGGALFLIGVVILGAGVFVMPHESRDGGYIPALPEENISPSISSTPFSASYTLRGEVISLADGRFARELNSESASRMEVEIFGEPVYADLDGDGDQDAALFMVEQGGGSGSFFYAALSLNDNGSYQGTNLLFLGDRIAPQNINIVDGRAVVNFAERRSNEPFTTQPSVGKSIYIHLDPNTKEIGEWVKDFEGEANPEMMTLQMKKWEWVRTEYQDRSIVTPRIPGKFTLTFTKDGRVSVGTDCNNMGGNYTYDKSKLQFEQMMSTLMYCEGSQESEFSEMLASVSGYSFTGKGELSLLLKENKGTVVFR